MHEFERVFVTPDDGYHYFFGYYDKSPLSSCGDYLLALQVDFIDRIPESTDTARIGRFDLRQKEKTFVPFASTKSFNWQQGAMLQWLGPDFKTRVLFNDLRDGAFVSVIYDFATGTERQLPMAVYNVMPDGRHALCIDNERHYWCRRGYSYGGIVNHEKNANVVPGDGIFLLDLDSGATRLIVGVEAMNRLKPVKSMGEGANYLEHIMVSKTGSHFLYLHRWRTKSGIYARFYSAKTDGSDITLLNDSGRMSHFCWLDEHAALGWGGLQNPLNRMRRYNAVNKVIKLLMPLYRKVARGDSARGNTKISQAVSGDSYIVFDLRDGSKKRIAENVLRKDGHPSVSPTEPELLLTDTYPDKDCISELLVYDMKAEELIVVDRLKSIPELANSPLRCDLHPKWSFCGNYIAVDTLERGRRDMFLYAKTAT